MTTIDWITFEDNEFYHDQSRQGKFMSSHLLGDFKKSPLLYNKKVLGQIEEKRSDAFAFGSAAHKLILEGRDAFDAEYIISDGPINERTGKAYGKETQAFKSWAAVQGGKNIITTEDFGMCAKFQHSVWKNEAAAELLSKGVAEGVVRAEIEGVPCQIRMDWFNPEAGLVDYKTTLDLDYFESECRRLGYIRQMAFYRAVIAQVTGQKVDVHIIATEKCEPYRTGVWKIAPYLLDEFEQIVFALLRKYKSCKENNVWPTGYETVRLIDNN